MRGNNEFTLGHIYFEIIVETSRKHWETRSGTQERSLRERNRFMSHSTWKVFEVTRAKENH